MNLEQITKRIVDLKREQEQLEKEQNRLILTEKNKRFNAFETELQEGIWAKIPDIYKQFIGEIEFVVEDGEVSMNRIYFNKKLHDFFNTELVEIEKKYPDVIADIRKSCFYARE